MGELETGPRGEAGTQIHLVRIHQRHDERARPDRAMRPVFVLVRLAQVTRTGRSGKLTTGNINPCMMHGLIFPVVSFPFRPAHNTYAGREMVLSTSGRITVNASTSRLDPSNTHRHSLGRSSTQTGNGGTPSGDLSAGLENTPPLFR